MKISFNIWNYWFSTCLMDSSHFPHQLLCTEHVLNLNIKKVTDISFNQFGQLWGVFSTIFWLLYQKSLAQWSKSSGWQLEDHLFKPHQPQPKKKDLFVRCRGIYIGVYILVSTDKMKRCDFVFYNYFNFWKVVFL